MSADFFIGWAMKRVDQLGEKYGFVREVPAKRPQPQPERKKAA